MHTHVPYSSLLLKFFILLLVYHCENIYNEINDLYGSTLVFLDSLLMTCFITKDTLIITNDLLHVEL